MQRRFNVAVLAGAAVVVTAGMHARASVIAFQGFESSAGDTWSYQETTNATTGNNGVVSTTVGATDTPANSRIDSGSNSFQVETTVDTVAQTATLGFAPIVVSNYQSVQIDVPVAAISTSGGNGMDTSDTIGLFVSLNGAAFSTTPDLLLEGNANARWSFAGTGSATTTAGSGTGTTTGKLVSSNPFVAQSASGGTLPTGIANLYVNIPDGTTTVALEVAATDNSNSTSGSPTAEVWALDNIQLTGTQLPEPASLSLVVVSAAGLMARRRRLGSL